MHLIKQRDLKLSFSEYRMESHGGWLTLLEKKNAVATSAKKFSQSVSLDLIVLFLFSDA